MTIEEIIKEAFSRGWSASHIGAVSRSANTDEYTKGYRDGWRDCCKDQKEFD